MDRYSIKSFIQTHGILFNQVQLQRIFPDSKTFVDALPKKDPRIILKKFCEEKDQPGFNLKEFVHAYFTFPQDPFISIDSSFDIDTYIDQLWPTLAKQFPLQSGSTSIELPMPHIVPGGRFHECYYWDSYFTSLGLIDKSHHYFLQNMIQNFDYLIQKFGFIPNGNRIYYLSRSQQPLFSHLLGLYQNLGYDISRFIPSLKIEYDFWMKQGAHLVSYHEYNLNRYYDQLDTPREESFYEDYHLTNGKLKSATYRHLRSACESGWDFSSRWLVDPSNLSSIHTCDLFPIDLNCLLFHYEEMLIQHGYEELKTSNKKRKQAIYELFWNEQKGFFFDYNYSIDQQSNCYSLAGVYPLFVNLATNDQAKKIVQTIENHFLEKHGLLTTLSSSHQQWDGINGWAPLHWVAYKGLKNYGFHSLADEIATRWTKLVETVYTQSNKCVEKYNVKEGSLHIQDGEYTLQEGFGWTNGVYKALKQGGKYAL